MRLLNTKDLGQRLTRRDFLKLLLRGIIHIVLFSTGGLGYSMLVEPRMFKLERVQLKIKRLAAPFSGFRIAQISDIHMGGWMNVERFQQVADLISAQKPDVLLITGDFVVGHRFTESSKQYLQDIAEALTPLAASIPTYAVLGNHDYWADAKAVREVLSICNIMDLTNAVFKIERKGTTLHLCGVDDVWEGKVQLNKILDEMNEGAAILLAHEPDYADISASTGKFDLQVSGHTHGGQIVLPFVGPPVLPFLGRKYPSGLYKVGEMYQYTNRGIGMATLPVRWNCPPEITLFTLESSDL